MKVAKIASWGFYYLGDFVCRVMEALHMWWVYPLYNWCMRRSSEIQNKYNVQEGPWHDSTD